MRVQPRLDTRTLRVHEVAGRLFNPPLLITLTKNLEDGTWRAISAELRVVTISTDSQADLLAQIEDQLLRSLPADDCN